MDNIEQENNIKDSSNKDIIPEDTKNSDDFETKKIEFKKISSKLGDNSEVYFPSISTNYSNNLKKNNKPKYILPTVFKLDFSDEKLNYLYSKEYLDEIYINFLLEEQNLIKIIKKDYMNNQNEINEKMREILVDWLIEIHNQFHFKRKTLFQTILIIDLYLSQKIIHTVQLQLLGTACLLISCKGNEIFVPSIDQFLGLASNQYSKKELLRMELLVMQTLNFEIFYPTCEEYFNIISTVYNFNKVQHHFGEYFLDSSLIDYKMLKNPPSTIALSCAYIVMKFFGLDGYKDLYKSKLISGNATGITIKECAKDLCFLVKNLPNTHLTATKLKYSSQEFENVAGLCQ